jgi:hypothetical protein
VVKKYLTSLTLKCQIKKMHQSEEVPDINATYEEPDAELDNFVRRQIIEPFASRILEDLLDVFQEVELSDVLISDLKKAGAGPTPAKRQRKPQTPQKIIKEPISVHRSS